MKIKQLTSYPNPNELGMGNTNETYIRVENSLDVSDIFPDNTEVTITDCKTGKQYNVKAKVERSEYRINKMGQLYRDYKVHPGDEIKFTYIEKQQEIAIFFNVTNYKRVFLSVTSKGTEIVNIDNLSGFSQDLLRNEYIIPINEGQLLLKYEKSEKKRADSPNETPFYISKVNDVPVAKGNYYITLNASNNVLEEVKKNIVEEYSLPEVFSNVPIISSSLELPLQQITYGAPGTGKSHRTNEVAKAFDNYRTTFHPDSDYSTFVGCYKPTMKKSTDTITYEFVPQAFTKAYVNAWKNLCGDKAQKEVFLIVEEINRGNCAQIFGDLFQLLDRKEDGYSQYAIEADTDLCEYLRGQFENVAGMPENVKSGKELLLPPNLYIWATMNTSDQSLFPIDSAFKRRWDWKYVPISNKNEDFKIVAKAKDATDGKTYTYTFDWWDFLERINLAINEATNSEDKKLGYFFCKADNDKKISADKFVSKVLFYLWNDVFKDYEVGDVTFKKDDKTYTVLGYEEGGKKESFRFPMFFDAEGNANEEMVVKFLSNIDVKNDKVEVTV